MPGERISERCARDIAEAEDELYLWTRVPGADSGLTEFARLSRAGHTLSLAIVESPHSQISPAIKLLASALVPSGN